MENNEQLKNLVPGATIEASGRDNASGHGANSNLSVSVLPADPIRERVFAHPVAATSRFRIDRSAGVWTVTKDGRFSGDYFREDHARAAVATATGA